MYLSCETIHAIMYNIYIYMYIYIYHNQTFAFSINTDLLPNMVKDHLFKISKQVFPEIEAFGSAVLFRAA